MAPGYEANGDYLGKCFYFLYSNDMLSILIRLGDSMNTQHKFIFKIRNKNP